MAMKIVEILKNYKDGNTHLLKGQKYDVMGWKADELIQLQVAKLVYKDVETNMLVNFETR
jgi:hypothetical protein